PPRLASSPSSGAPETPDGPASADLRPLGPVAGIGRGRRGGGQRGGGGGRRYGLPARGRGGLLAGGGPGRQREPDNLPLAVRVRMHSPAVAERRDQRQTAAAGLPGFGVPD